MSQETREATSAARRRALEVFALMRAHGARFYREYMSVRVSPSEDGVGVGELPVDVPAMGPRGCVSPGSVATLADVVLGMAVRSGGDGEFTRRTATLGLTMQFFRDASQGSVHVRAEVQSVTPHLGVSQCRITDDQGDLVALGQASFAIRSLPRSREWLPYDKDLTIVRAALPPVAPDSLTKEEGLLLKRVENSVANGGADGIYGAFLGIDWETRGEGVSRGIWTLGPHVWNRTDSVQGGAMFGGLATAALACFPSASDVKVVEQHVQYVRPCQLPALKVEARINRRGKMLSSVTASALNESGEVVATSVVTLEGVQ